MTSFRATAVRHLSATGLAAAALFAVTGCDPQTPPQTGSAPPPAAASPSWMPSGMPSAGPSGAGGIGSAPPSKAAAVTVPPFFAAVPALPKVSEAAAAGVVRQQQRVAGRDNGQSTRYGDRSVWIFDDTTFKDPWGFISNSGAATEDLDAADGIDLTSGSPVTADPAKTPVELIPRSAAEKAYEQANKVLFGFWPGPVVADPARGRVLVFYGKLCRGGPAGSTCTDPLGKGLGTGIAAIDMTTGAVTRLTAVNGPAVSSVEGGDPTMFFPDSLGWSSSALVVGDVLYAYGACTYHGCKLGKVGLGDVTDRRRWTFWTGGGWGSDPAAGAVTIAPGAAGQTVFYAPALKAWLNVFMPFGSNDVMFQVGGAPFGPWSKPVRAMTTQGGKAANYALFGHPEYAQRDGLVQYLSYFHPDSGDQRLVKLTFAAGT